MAGFPAGPANDTPPSVRSIYAILRQDIISLRAMPGEKLSENELAGRFGTSRAPVREALIRLGEDGLIDVRPQRGSFVSRISLKAMERSRFVRAALESAVIRRAAELGISSEVHGLAEASLAAQATAHDQPERFTQLDDVFHRGFAESVDLASVWSIIEREKVQFDRIRCLSLPVAIPVDRLIGQHRAILNAVLDRKAVEAEAAMRLHLYDSQRIIGELAARHPDLIIVDL